MVSDTPTAPQASDLEIARQNFVEKIGVFFQTEGMPRTAGRLLGLLIFDGSALSFGDLAEKLQVSRASISTSSRLLLQAGLIERVSKPGERQDYFQLADKPYEALISTEIARMQHAQTEIAKAIQTIPEKNRGTCQRLGALCNFFQSMETGLKGALPTLTKKNS